ncbi:MAG: thiamine-phosphate kinase, partial [Chromatiales bacterium]|nr:thiamine-phosphate kinase [Chromatiales bacterium]
LPEVDEGFLQPFSDHFLQLAQQYDVALIGGDTVRGPLTITVQIIGTVPADKALKRSGAKVGDAIFVSGSLGDAAKGLSLIFDGYQNSDDERYLVKRLNRPTARIELGEALRDLATSAIDISDGLLADLGHILEQSGVGAEITSDKIPCSDALLNILPNSSDRIQLMVTGGDDYELCFTVPALRIDEVNLIAERLALPLTQIGSISKGSSLLLDGVKIEQQGFDHFKVECHEGHEDHGK